MENADYLDVALRLANSDLVDLDALRAALHDEPWWAGRAGEEDLRLLREVADGLRRALASVVSGSSEDVLREVNAMLAAHPPRPRLSAGPGPRREGPNGHVHVGDVDAPPAREVAAAAAWGLAQGVVRHGLTRWGRCAAEGC